MGHIFRRNCDLREFRSRVRWLSLVWEFRIPIRCVITPLWSPPNPLSQVISLISRISSDLPLLSQLHPPSLPSSSTTQPSSQNTKLRHPSLSLCMRWSTVNTQNSIRWVLHTPHTASSQQLLSSTPSQSHLSADHVVLNSLHSHNSELTNE